MDMNALLPCHVDMAKLMNQDAGKNQDDEATRKQEYRRPVCIAKSAPVYEHPNEDQHEGWMEPDLYTVQARDSERFAHGPRLPIFGIELKRCRYEKWPNHAHMLDLAVGMTRPQVERPPMNNVRYLQHD
jgi:hypothetical protein